MAKKKADTKKRIPKKRAVAAGRRKKPKFTDCEPPTLKCQDNELRDTVREINVRFEDLFARLEGAVNNQATSITDLGGKLRALTSRVHAAEQQHVDLIESHRQLATNATSNRSLTERLTTLVETLTRRVSQLEIGREARKPDPFVDALRNAGVSSSLVGAISKEAGVPASPRSTSDAKADMHDLITASLQMHATYGAAIPPEVVRRYLDFIATFRERHGSDISKW